MADLPTIRQFLIDAIDAEEGATRRTLERIPQERWDWAPHERSMPMGRLAGWVAGALGAIPDVLRRDFVDIATGWGDMPPRPTAAAELVPTFDAAVRRARDALAQASDDVLAGPWSLRQGDAVLDGPSPRYKVVHGFLIVDLIHHRAQLGVGLRLCGVPVPAVYGPSADEGGA